MIKKGGGYRGGMPEDIDTKRPPGHQWGGD